MSTKKVARCLAPGCKNKQFSRGLCQACSAIARLRIRQGEVSEKKLMDMGLLLPPKRQGREVVNPLSKAIEKIGR